MRLKEEEIFERLKGYLTRWTCRVTYIAFFGVQISSMILGIVAILVFVISGMKVYHLFRTVVSNISVPEDFGLSLIRILESYFLAILIYIVAIGLHDIFVGGLELPEALQMDTIGDLEEKLLGVIVILLIVRFLELMYGFQGLHPLLFGGAIVLLAAGIFIYLETHRRKYQKHE